MGRQYQPFCNYENIRPDLSIVPLVAGERFGSWPCAWSSRVRVKPGKTQPESRYFPLRVQNATYRQPLTTIAARGRDVDQLCHRLDQGVKHAVAGQASG